MKGCALVDLGRAPDDPEALAACLRAAAASCDAVLTSGGASAGDEDHIAQVITDLGQLETWRIAIKPGRPLALGMIDGVPIFGLPGNPVAAYVCTLLFAHPVFCALAGAHWHAPRGVLVPAGFAKSKKPGRMEYLRARLDDEGRAEVFGSEGSGRVSGLTWSTGLIELPHEAATIKQETPVRFIPYNSFGLGRAI